MRAHDPEFEELVDRILDKYAEILGIQGLPSPNVKVRDNLGAKALGVCRWSTRDPDTTTIEVQRSIVDHPDTLERVIAHEMIHHQDFLEAKPWERTRMGARLADGHGRRFLAKAELINAIMGPGYVTAESDETYEVEPNEKEFFLLIAPAMSRRLGWAWAARISHKMEEEILKRQTAGGKLIVTTDGRWTKGVKIKKFGGASVPKVGSDDEAELARLYAQEP